MSDPRGVIRTYLGYVGHLARIGKRQDSNQIVLLDVAI